MVLAGSRIPQDNASALGPTLDLLWQAHALEKLGRGGERQQALDKAGRSLEALAREGKYDELHYYSLAMQWYQAERGNPAAVRHWIEEYRRRLRQQEKGNVPEETARHMGYALNLATVGLHEEAIAELNTMLAQPGGFSFVFVSPVAGTGVDLLVTSAPPGESA